VKAVVIGIAVLNVLRITQSLAGSFEAQKDTPEWKSFAAKVDSVWERLGPLLRERVDDNIPHFAADDRFQTTFVRIMSDSDDRPKGGRSSNSKP
jgi:hypothetical protein